MKRVQRIASTQLGLRQVEKQFNNLKMRHTHFIAVLVLLSSVVSDKLYAGVYKCTDEQGKTAYQSSPCAQDNKAAEIDIRTGGLIDLSVEEKQKKQQEKFAAQLEAEKQNQLALEAKRIKDSEEQSAINQQLIKNNPVQYTAFAIPPYKADALPGFVKPYQARLPEIEKFRRLAAQKALATGDCVRVESDELSIKSKVAQLVFSVDCSSAKTFIYNETELTQ